MGKKKGSNQQGGASAEAVDNSTVGASSTTAIGEAPSVTDADTYVEEEELELLQVDLGDMVKIKQVMDETVASQLLEHVPEDYRWDNFKLFIMSLACMFAMIAQFAPIPFPDSRPILGICGSLYFVFSGILQLITTFIDQDSILWTSPVPKNTTSNKDMEKYGLVVRTCLERFSEWYTVTIEFHPNQKDSSDKSQGQPPSFVHQRWSIGQFFDKEGYFDEIGVTQEVDTLFKRFEAGDYDKSPIDEDINKAKKD